MNLRNADAPWLATGSIFTLSLIFFRGHVTDSMLRFDIIGISLCGGICNGESIGQIFTTPLSWFVIFFILAMVTLKKEDKIAWKSIITFFLITGILMYALNLILDKYSILPEEWKFFLYILNILFILPFFIILQNRRWAKISASVLLIFLSAFIAIIDFKRRIIIRNDEYIRQGVLSFFIDEGLENLFSFAIIILIAVYGLYLTFRKQ